MKVLPREFKDRWQKYNKICICLDFWFSSIWISTQTIFSVVKGEILLTVLFLVFGIWPLASSYANRCRDGYHYYQSFWNRRNIGPFDTDRIVGKWFSIWMTFSVNGARLGLKALVLMQFRCMTSWCVVWIINACHLHTDVCRLNHWYNIMSSAYIVLETFWQDIFFIDCFHFDNLSDWSIWYCSVISWFRQRRYINPEIEQIYQTI